MKTLMNSQAVQVAEGSNSLMKMPELRWQTSPVGESRTVWQKRVAALIGRIETLSQHLQNRLDNADDNAKGNVDNARITTLYSLCRSLAAFAQSHFDFFHDGFYGEDGVRLEPSYTYPAPYVLRTLLDQIAFDVNVLEQAVAQRLFTSTAEAHTLQQADMLAYCALQPALKLNLLADATVITYFGEAHAVRTIPYAPLVLISIPYTAVENKSDLLAIPHEVGHYIFQHGVAEKAGHKAGRFSSVLNHDFAGEPPWLRRWLAEIFADVYGTLIAGPAMALSFQALVTDGNLVQFTHDNGAHPVPALRPHIYMDVLDQINQQVAVEQRMENAVAQLRTHWNTWFAARWSPEAFTPYGAAPETANMIQLPEAQALISAVAGKILHTYLAQLMPQSPHAVPMWSGELAGDDVCQLYADFEQHYLGALDTELSKMDSPPFICSKVPELLMQDDAVGLQWVAQDPATVQWRNLGETGLWIDSVKQAAQCGDTFKLPPEAWMALLDSSGWALAGPQDMGDDK